MAGFSIRNSTKLIHAQRRSFSHGSSPIISASLLSTNLTILSFYRRIPWASSKLIHGTHSISSRSKAWTTATLSHPAITGQSTRFQQRYNRLAMAGKYFPPNHPHNPIKPISRALKVTATISGAFPLPLTSAGNITSASTAPLPINTFN